MDKKLLKQLVDYSYMDNSLNFERISKVEKLLKNKRKDLKKYISALKIREKSHNIIIDIPMNNFDYYKNEFKKSFVNKNITWNIDPSLLLGLRITEGDNVLEVNLKKSLENIVTKIKQNYD